MASPLSRFLFVAKFRGTSTERSVLLVLTDRADDETLECWPHQSTIAVEAGCSVKTVKRTLASLRRKGIIDWRRGRYGLLYRLQMGHDDLSDRSKRPIEKGQHDLQNLPREPSQRTHRERDVRRRPTFKQVAYIESLAREKGVEVPPEPSTWAEASELIDALKANAHWLIERGAAQRPSSEGGMG